MVKTVNAKFIGAISFSFDPKLSNSEGFSKAISRSYEKISEVIESSLSSENLTKLEAELKASLNSSLSNDDWMKIFRGRNVLKRFSGKHRVSYEVLRNLIVGRMRLVQYRPKGMETVIDSILSG